MLLTLTTTHRPATDLGYLLHKNPARAHSFDLSHATAHVFYPEASEEACTAALLLEVDPVGLARGARSPDATLATYVNDRPYAASSLVSVAMAKVFGSAMRGRSKDRPELAGTAIELRIEVPVLPCRGGPELVARLFEPLGWQVVAEPVPLDPAFPRWGESRYVRLVLTGRARVADALNQLYVLLPVLDDAKHYWLAPDEVDKLVRAGGDWLAGHPERQLITRRYLAYRSGFTRLALARLAAVDDTEPAALDNAVVEEETTETDGTSQAGDAVPAEPATAPERPVPLAHLRHRAVLDCLRTVEAARVLDLGCGSGALLGELLADTRFAEIVGADVSHRALAVAARRLHLDRLSDRQRERIQLLQSALTYTDQRLAGYDAAVLMEVIEHVDADRLPALEYAVFGAACPGAVVVTTPNVEYNVRYETLPAGHSRHHDHRFEWNRAEFAAWAERVAGGYGYAVELRPVGEEDPEVGPPTQLALFRKVDHR